MQKVVVPIVAVVCLGFMGYVIYLFVTDKKPGAGGAPVVAQGQQQPRPQQQQQQRPAAPGPKVNEPAPEISGEDVDGKAFKLSDYKGKVVVLDFWGFW